VIGTSRSNWLERTCARRARAVKIEPETHSFPLLILLDIDTIGQNIK